MMEWTRDYLPEAREDIRKLDGTVRERVLKILQRTAHNPLPQSEGGYGKPLGNKDGYNLTGLLKVKLKRDGIRIVYKLERAEDVMKIVVVGVRSDMEVYREACRRKDRHGL